MLIATTESQERLNGNLNNAINMRDCISREIFAVHLRAPTLFEFSPPHRFPQTRRG